MISISRPGTAVTALLAGIFLFGSAARADSSCEMHTVRMAPPAGSGADSIAQVLNGVSNISIKALDPTTFFICAETAAVLTTAEQTVDRLLADSAGAAWYAAKPAPKERPESSQMRVFFHHDVTSLATALDKAVGGIGVSASPPDLLVFKPSGATTDDSSIRELKRLVALIDSPRPEITLNAWSVQVSADKPEAVDALAKQVRDTVYRYNHELQNSLQRAWAYLSVQRKPEENRANPFANYVLDNFASNSGNPTCTHRGASDPYGYCLGYEGAFSEVMQPSIMNMVGILAGLAKPDLNAFVDQLEGATRPDAGRECDERDEALPARAPGFECFRDQLLFIMANKDGDFVPLARLRAAMADFLFQYKFSIEYLQDFDAYEYAKSAQRLDVELDPLLVAFNHDVVVYLRKLQNELRCGKDANGPKRKCAEPSGYAENGVVTIRTISGTDSSVSTQTQSSFKTTPPPLVQDFLTQLQNASSTMPGVLSSNLAANPASALTAFLNSGKSATVTLGKDLNLTVSPITLPGASAAELKMTLESKDDAAPQQITPDGKSANDTSNRVAVHSVSTNVRVDSLKLFEISTFSAELSRGREPISLVPPLVKLPYIPPLVKWQPKPSKAYHQSFAIISATILPTAADLLNGLEFSGDQADADGNSIYPIADEDRKKLVKDIVSHHRQMLDCIVKVTLAPNADGKAICPDPGKTEAARH
jgi:hypothetical protein